MKLFWHANDRFINCILSSLGLFNAKTNHRPRVAQHALWMTYLRLQCFIEKLFYIRVGKGRIINFPHFWGKCFHVSCVMKMIAVPSTENYLEFISNAVNPIMHHVAHSTKRLPMFGQEVRKLHTLYIHIYIWEIEVFLNNYDIKYSYLKQKICKQIYLTYRWGLNRYYHLSSVYNDNE